LFITFHHQILILRIDVSVLQLVAVVLKKVISGELQGWTVI
jgi:hypothetical protein